MCQFRERENNGGVEISWHCPFTTVFRLTHAVNERKVLSVVTFPKYNSRP